MKVAGEAAATELAIAGPPFARNSLPMGSKPYLEAAASADATTECLPNAHEADVAMIQSLEGAQDAASSIAYVPVPPDGMCMWHAASAARNVEAWMAGRDEHRWVRNAERERADLAEAHALLQRVMAGMEATGHCVDAARLRLAGAVGYGGSDELPHVAAELGGRIEQMDFDYPDGP